MKKLLLISTAALLAGATLAMAQNPATPPAATAPSTSAPTVTPPANKPSTAAPSDKKPGDPPKSTQSKEQPSAPKAAQRDQQQPPKAAQPGRTQAPSEQTPGTPSASQAQTPGQSNSTVSVNLTTEQRATIRSTVLKGGDVPRSAKVDFQINVGSTVPRTVRIVQLPATVIQIHPAWRGYMYFVVGDEIVIVEPGTMRIVAVVPA